MINLTDYHLHLVLCPVDMRRGFRSLSALAGIALGVDVYLSFAPFPTKNLDNNKNILKKTGRYLRICLLFCLYL